MQSISKKKYTVKISVADKKTEGFTTLLQSGAGLDSRSGTPLGVFLNSLPGFSEEYLTDRVQTIFLDGNAIDDLERPFSKPIHIVALSAAMPGLAGAIFRKNSLCAALRTSQIQATSHSRDSIAVRIRLKLFNAIAQERGMEILHHGAFFSGETLYSFFHSRPSLLPKITKIVINNNEIIPKKFLQSLKLTEEYFLTIETVISGC